MLDRFVRPVRENGDRLNMKLATEIIKAHEEQRDYMKSYYGRFCFDKEYLPIMNRDSPDTQDKVDQRVANDWFGELVNTKVGYTYSLPVGIGYDPFLEDENEDSTEKVHNVLRYIERYNKINDFHKFSSDIGRYSSITGYDAILCYVSKGQERHMRIDPWEVVFLTETTLHEPPYSFRYYYDLEDKLHIEFYTNTHRVEYIGNGTVLETITEEPHMFDLNPLFGMANNDELQSDGHKVETLIDAYDAAVSDFSSEVAQFRLAYLVFTGTKPTQKVISDMIKTGAIYIPNSDLGGGTNSVEFLQKEINDQAVKNLSDTLEANITRFGRHVNFSDAAFGSDISSPAMRWKLFMMEQKAAESVINHQAALRRLYAVLASSWKERLPDLFSDFEAIDLDFQYRRNIPANDKDSVETAVNLMSIASRMAAMEYLKGIIPNAGKEYERWWDEQQGNNQYLVDDGAETDYTDEELAAGDGTNDGTAVSGEERTNEV